MTGQQCYIVKFFCFIVTLVNFFECHDMKFKSNLLDIKQIGHEIFSKNDFNVSNVIFETISQHNWTENRECLMELNTIKNGIDNFEEWAFERM